MELTEELAEMIGVFVGDGCLSQSKRKDRKGYSKEVVFTGSWDKDSQYYMDIIQPIIYKNFDLSSSLVHRKDDNSMRLRIYNQTILPSFLIKLGFNFGPKSRTVEIPLIILNDISLQKSFIRGLFNTDGTIYKRYSKPYGNHKKTYSDYKVIQFKSASKKLMEQTSNILLDLGFNPNRIIKERDAWVCRITSQKEVKRFGNEIITNHTYHKNRFLNK